MTVAYDNFARLFRTNTSDPVTWTHTPTGTPRAILVWIGQRDTEVDHINTVTYGGVAMTRVVRAIDNSGEFGALDLWRLGAAIPTGPQTVSVDLLTATTDDMYFVSESFTAAGDCEVVAFDHIDQDAANPQKLLAYGGRTCLGLCGTFSGHAQETSLVDLAGQVRVDNQWSTTARGWVLSRRSVAESSDQTLGYTAANEDIAFIAVAISEVVVVPPSGTLTFSFFIPDTIDVGNDLYLATLSLGHTAGTDLPTTVDTENPSNPWTLIGQSVDRKDLLWTKKATAQTRNAKVTVLGGVTELCGAFINIRATSPGALAYTNLAINAVPPGNSVAGFTPAFSKEMIVLIAFNKYPPLANPFTNIGCTDPANLDIKVVKNSANCGIVIACAPQLGLLGPTGPFTWDTTSLNALVMRFGVKPLVGGGSSWTTETKVDDVGGASQTVVEKPLFGTDVGLTYTIDPSILSLGGFWVSKQFGKPNDLITLDRVRVVATALEAGLIGVSFTFDGGLTYSDEIGIPILPGIKGSNVSSGWTTVTGQVFQVKVRHLAGEVFVHEINIEAQPRGRAN